MGICQPANISALKSFLNIKAIKKKKKKKKKKKSDLNEIEIFMKQYLIQK